MQHNKLVTDGFQSAHIIILVLDMDSLFSLATAKSAANGNILSGTYLNLFKSKTGRRFAKSRPADFILRTVNTFTWPLKSVTVTASMYVYSK